MPKAHGVATGLSGSPSWQRYRLITDATTDMVYETDTAGIIQWASPSARDLLGWDPVDLVGTSSLDLVHPLDVQRITDLRTALYLDGLPQDNVGCMIRTATSGYREVTLRAQPLRDTDDAVTGVIVTMSDTHDRDSTLRALTTLSQANRALVRALDEDDLLQGMCDTIAQTGRYPLAWYGRPIEDESRTVIPVARAGERTAYLDTVSVSWGDTPLGRGPTGRCLRSRQTQVENDFTPDPDYTPWRDAAARHGFGSSISLPVLVHGTVDGALMVYATEPGSFDALAQELMETRAAALGYGIERRRGTADLERASQQAQQQRDRLQATLDSQLDPFILLEGVRDETGTLVDLRYLEANPAALTYNQTTRDELIGARVLDLYPNQRGTHAIDQYFHTIETGEPTILDDYAYENLVVGGDRRYDIRAVRSSDGIALTWRDVTDRHVAAKQLADSEHMYRLLAENSTDVIILRDEQLRILWASPSTASVLGVDAADVVGRSVTEFVYPADVDAMTDAIADAHASGTGLRYRIRVRTVAGEYRWFDGRNRPLATPAGEPPTWVVSLQDIDDQVRAEQDLTQREELYRLLAENTNDVILLADPDTRISWASPSSASTLGWGPTDLVGHRSLDFIHPDDVPTLRADVERSTRTGATIYPRYRWRRPDGTYHWMGASGRPIVDERTGVQRRVVTLRDVDVEVHAEEDRAASEARYRLLAENASDMVVQVEPDGTVAWVSPSVRGMLGWDVEELVGVDSLDLVHPDDRQRAHDTRPDSAAGRPSTGEFRILRKDGSALWTSLTIHPVPTDRGVARVLALRDIEHEVEARTRLDFALRHDQSTGLPTRAAMADVLHDELVRASDRSGIALLSIGIDLLKDVNDAYGHAAGDVVVETVARRVVEAVGRSHVVGRGTGDEFMVILTDMLDPAEAAAIAERVRVGVHGELALADRTVAPTVSIGIAMARPDGTSDALQQEATLALHRAKELGRDRWAFADADLARTAARRMALESAIREGLDAGEFQPWFQPIVSLTDDTIAGYEALIRWQHRDQVMDPSQFLEVALHTPMIADLDLAMVEPVVVALAAQPAPVFIAVNVTGLTLARADYAAHVAACLARHGVPPSRLHVEITETMLLGLDETVVAQIATLADLGVHWYVDDFGTGYSSISHLRDLPVSGLKLDASFTAGIGAGSHTSRQLAVALIGLANGLGLDTVAEGIETRAEADYLRTLGWRHGQGWLYGKAAPLH